ncbi:MAG: NADH-quinone oxidoreductase subunit N [Candidatus Omnitrophica bacterium CG_4_10_14_0_2_um_filter_44_9]|nr:MAG: NADH-quinone oxidoreductase subunit N [Candidatus Omnitrophica bacterium CG_4_10_14_0_8_um_filter_44_12]PIZ83653.1 MAG: NADH-quinone oxidoreductase subunit N [Candidatus Omnitrophica bacterium CG_4_10_14_0_2_um_filter_44_9]
MLSFIETFQFILPEVILLVFALAILVCSLLMRSKGLLGALALTAVVLASLFLPRVNTTHASLFFNMLTDDAFSTFFKVICLFITGVIILISMGYKTLQSGHIGEYYFLLLSATIAMLLAVSSNNLIMIYISLEMLSLASYILVGFFKHDDLSSEGALKYFIFGALSTGIMLYGISLIYGVFGTMDLSAIANTLKTAPTNALISSVLLLFILAGLSFKCALVPFHMWAPDAYQGAPTSISAFISVGPKAVGFAVLLRIFTRNFLPLYADCVTIIMLVSVFTMTIGNIIAISQTNIKRMLAYSSIAQAGYILIGFVVGTASGTEGALYYIFAYTLMNLGAFGCIVLISNSIRSDNIEDYAGLSKKDPVSAFMLAVFLLSLAGIPPLAGFFGKFMVFAAAIGSKFIFLAVAGALNSVIAVYYYVKVIKYMYLDEPKATEMKKKPAPLQIALIIIMIGVLIAGIYPSPFLNWIRLSQVFFLQ